MIQRMILAVLLISLFVFSTGFSIDENVVDTGINPVEDFFRRTIRRFNDAWLLSDIEFDRAKTAVAEIPGKMRDQATEYVKDAVDKAVDKAVNNAVDQAAAQAASFTDRQQQLPQKMEPVRKASANRKKK